MKTLLVGTLLAAGLLAPPALPPFRLDEAGGVGGIRFGQPLAQVAGLKSSFNGFGKRWRGTQLCSRPGDTTQLGGLGAPTAYWFRASRFIGIDKQLPSADAIGRAYQLLTAQYGPARPDTLPDQWHWLGQHSYILLEKTSKNGGCLFIASLAMLNEQVYETGVRARARRLLGWQPDSLGLPRQFPAR